MATKKVYLILALILALTLSGGAYAYTYTTTTGTIGIAEPTGDIATVATAANQPNWNSVLPVGGVGTEILRPDSPGDDTGISGQFPNTGQHWNKVSETTSDGDSTYVYTDTSSWQEDLYDIGDHSAGSGNINYVKVYMVCRSTSNPSQASARIHTKTEGSQYDGDQVTVTTSYALYSYQWNTNPDTGGAWTWAEVDALQIGVGLRRARNGAETRCTQVYAEVSYETTPAIEGEVPSGDLFVVTPHAGYSGDLLVNVYLTNTAALVKAYQYLNIKLYLEGSVEASETPNYRLLTLDNGGASFNLESGVGGSHTLSVTGGSYRLVSDDPSEWGAGWSVTPELYCQVIQR